MSIDNANGSGPSPGPAVMVFPEVKIEYMARLFAVAHGRNPDRVTSAPPLVGMTPSEIAGRYPDHVSRPTAPKLMPTWHLYRARAFDVLLNNEVLISMVEAEQRAAESFARTREASDAE